MITAIDTNVLIDVAARTKWFETSSLACRNSRNQGALVICEIVYAELAIMFAGNQSKLDGFLNAVEVAIKPSSKKAMVASGKIMQEYRIKGGSKARILADFYIGSHAAHEADRLLTRDHGFFRSYFKDLLILEPKIGDV